VAPAAAGGTLANLIVRKGQLKGHRFPIRVPIVNVGRAEYNDIVVPDSSVSSAHAKIQLREGIWILVDLGSTNGTFVDGDQVSGEAPIAPGALIRFGEVSLVFESTKDDSAQQDGGTQILGAIEPPEGMA
jgi:pSer/pThr/pTyr-binding forkhead associated (FHA) protein